jgi:hypothetical protein
MTRFVCNRYPFLTVLAPDGTRLQFQRGVLDVENPDHIAWVKRSPEYGRFILETSDEGTAHGHVPRFCAECQKAFSDPLEWRLHQDFHAKGGRKNGDLQGHSGRHRA